MNRLLLLAFWLSITGFARADITMMVDKVDPTDGVTLPPPHLAVIDVGVSLTDADAYQSLGVRAVPRNGAGLEYLRDPNGVAIPTAPGGEFRFVTFFSRPRPRDEDSRFGTGATVTIVASYTSGPAPVFLPGELNAALWVQPPFWQPGVDGWVGRIVIDLSDVVDPLFRTDSASIVIASSQPPNSIPLLEISAPAQPGLIVHSTANDHDEITFGVYGIIPEPTTSLGLLIVAGVLLRRR